MKSQQLQGGTTYNWAITATAPTPEDSVDLLLFGNLLLKDGLIIDKAFSERRNETNTVYAKDKGKVSLNIANTAGEDRNIYLGLGIKSSLFYSDEVLIQPMILFI